VRINGGIGSIVASHGGVMAQRNMASIESESVISGGESGVMAANENENAYQPGVMAASSEACSWRHGESINWRGIS